MEQTDRAQATWPPMSVVERVLLVAFLAFVVLLAAAPISCSDFFWHLEIGRVILRDHHIPDTDMFSAVHPNAPYVQPQWLWELVAALVHGAGGLRGIRVMQGVVLGATFAGLLLGVRRLLGRATLAWLITALALVLFVDRFRARPDALTLGFFALSLPLLLPASARPLRMRAAYAFALGVLWANMHGGASLLLLLSLGAVLVGTWLDARALGRDAVRVSDAAAVLACAVLGLALSPTLIRGLVHWATLIGPQIETGNEEWLPTYTMLRHGATPVTLLVASLPSVVLVAYVVEQAQRYRRKGRAGVRMSEWLLAAGYLALSELAVRNAFLCLLPVVFMARRAAQRPASGRVTWAAVVASAMLIAGVFDDVVLGSLGGIERARALMGRDLLPGTYPEQAGGFLADARIKGGVFNEGAWGGYLIFRCWPACHVLVDTRQNLTPEMWQVFLASRSAEQRPAALEAAFRAWDLELAVFRGPTFPLVVPPPTWQLLYKAGDQEVYQRRGGSHEAQNVARARAYLTAHGARPDEPLSEAAARIGAAQWLALPEQQRTRTEAEAKLRAPDALTRRDAQLALAELWYRAGLHADAVRAYEAASQLGPIPARARYFAALSSFAIGDHEHARAQLAFLRGADLSSLSRRQRERMHLLEFALSRR